MLCTRCQQREARVWPAEKRAKFEAKFGMSWPMPDGLCDECWPEWFKTPEAQERMQEFSKVMRQKMRKDLHRWEQKVRSTTLKWLDFADELIAKL